MSEKKRGREYDRERKTERAREGGGGVSSERHCGRRRPQHGVRTAFLRRLGPRPTHAPQAPRGAPAFRNPTLRGITSASRAQGGEGGTNRGTLPGRLYQLSAWHRLRAPLPHLPLSHPRKSSPSLRHQQRIRRAQPASWNQAN